MVHKPYIETLPHRKVDVSLCQALMNCSSTCFVVDECERRGVSRWRCLPQLSLAHISNTFREAALSFNPTDMNHLLHEFLSSPQSFFRFFGRNNNVDKAAKLLKGTLEWRRQFGVSNLTGESVKAKGLKGKLFTFGADRLGRPTLFMRPGA